MKEFLNFAFSEKLLGSFKKGELSDIKNPWLELDPLIISGMFSVNRGDLIWLVDEEKNLEALRGQIILWLKFFNRAPDVHILPFPSEDPYFNDSISDLYINECIKILSNGRRDCRRILITTPMAVNVLLNQPDEFRKNLMKISTGDNIGRDRFIRMLDDSGYKFENWLEKAGEFSKKGGIIEVFPTGDSHPVRIEFYGSKVESVTRFHSETRYTVENINSIIIPDCRILGPDVHFRDLYKRSHLVSVKKILNNFITVVSEPGLVKESFLRRIKKFRDIFKINSEFTDLPGPDKLFPIDKFPVNSISLLREFSEIDPCSELMLLKKNIRDFSTSDLLELKKKSRTGYKIFIMSDNPSLKDNLYNSGIWINRSEKTIPFSFSNIKLSTIFLTEKKFRFIPDSTVVKSDYLEERFIGSLKDGDFIVHSIHGIGIYRGTSIIGIAGREQEFVKIEYRGREYLYVPVYELDQITKYESFKSVNPVPDKIGGKSFALKKVRARKSISIFAKELLDLYAKRKTVKGYSYAGDAELEGRIEESFLFNETPDQSKAIREVLDDLEKSYPMERLICGDVSFGKTEVALRAAFRVVISGRQVALLCPTTILALQHFKTFSKRLEGLSVRISMLSRMVPAREREKILKQTSEGRIDILIGTHSLLSAKVSFKNLGLYIIDEEQRFGVFQKEKLKKGRENVDVLTLSATPIPRTLSMSFAGLQDISVIRTPPQGRLAVKNSIGIFSKEKVVSAVLNETGRGGAVFIVYNSIDKIFTLKKNIDKWIPQVKTGVIHAKMSNREIERNMTMFIERKFPVLLSTTIIENGIDISHVNTLIVINAENFGLTQLYQLRGRIGRSHRQAYAYFLTKKSLISDKAILRLEGIRDHSRIGSGFELAELDLKLRGAGSLLGNRQHGHVEALGFEFYNKLLRKTVEELKGEKRESNQVKLHVDFNYHIDNSYIDVTAERINLFSEISNAGSISELENLKNKIEANWGQGGDSLSKLFYVGKVKCIVSKINCESVRIRLNSLSLKFNNIFPGDIKLNKSFLKKYKSEFPDKYSVLFRFNDPDGFLTDFEDQLNS